MYLKKPSFELVPSNHLDNRLPGLMAERDGGTGANCQQNQQIAGAAGESRRENDQ
jgi:hypothetical protein